MADPGLLLAGRTVLVVDDNDIEEIVLRDLLVEATGVRVLSAADGLAALALLAREPVDLVLMDVRMPGLDGHETTRRLRALPGLDRLPVIGMTGHVTTRDRAAALASGMDDHLTKPLIPRTLLATLSRWLGEAGQPAAAPAGASFSPALALERCLGRRALLEKIARRYLDTRAGLPEELARLWLAGDREGAARAAHSLVSTAASLGAAPLSEIARSLQAAAEAGDAAWWNALLSQARDEHASLCSALRRWLENPETPMAPVATEGSER